MPNKESGDDEIIAIPGLPNGGNFEPLSIPGLEETPLRPISGLPEELPLVASEKMASAESGQIKSVELDPQSFEQWGTQVVEIGRKVVQNIENVNRVGGEILHPGISLKTLKNLLNEFLQINIPDQKKDHVREIANQLLSQSPNTGIDTDLIERKLKELERLLSEEE